MGYYSQMEMNVQIKKNKISEFKRKVERLKEEAKQHERNSGRTSVYDDKYGVVSWFLEGMEVSDEGEMEWVEYYAKWYDSEAFVKLIAPFVTKGTLTFTGEDGEKEGYSFDGLGKVWLIRWVEQRENEVYFDSNKEEE